MSLALSAFKSLVLSFKFIYLMVFAKRTANVSSPSDMFYQINTTLLIRNVLDELLCCFEIQYVIREVQAVKFMPLFQKSPA